MYKLKFKNASWGEEATVSFRKSEYSDGNTAIMMICEDEDCKGEPYAALTTNLTPLMPNFAYIDVNNLSPNIISRLVEEGMISKPVSYRQSGYVAYPLVELYDKFLDQMEELY